MSVSEIFASVIQGSAFGPATYAVNAGPTKIRLEPSGRRPDAVWTLELSGRRSEPCDCKAEPSGLEFV